MTHKVCERKHNDAMMYALLKCAYLVHMQYDHHLTRKQPVLETLHTTEAD